MNNYFTRLSFEKLENFDMQRSKLSSFVLIRNSLITALTTQQPLFDPTIVDNMLFEEEEEEQVWLDSCFHDLDNKEEDYIEEDDGSSEEEEEDDSMPLSPQDDVSHTFYTKKKPTFFINEDEEEEEDGLICYDIPFLSLVHN